MNKHRCNTCGSRLYYTTCWDLQYKFQRHKKTRRHRKAVLPNPTCPSGHRVTLSDGLVVCDACQLAWPVAYFKGLIAQK